MAFTHTIKETESNPVTPLIAPSSDETLSPMLPSSGDLSVSDEIKQSTSETVDREIEPVKCLVVPASVLPDATSTVLVECLEACAPPAEDPIPARMLNEFVYCKRLFYYEYVEGVFTHNADTVRGAAIHARVDKGTGALPPAGLRKKRGSKATSPTGDQADEADTGPEVIHSRSATLGSARLGVIAKLDLAEVRIADGPSEDFPEVSPSGEKRAEICPGLPTRSVEVCPVDYKAGAPREGDEGKELWPTDRMQLGLQMVILRDNGYECRRGIIYYRTTKQRVSLEWSTELEEWIVAQIAEARSTMKGPIPAPLVGSSKCVRCSLNSVCLPDETRLLAACTEVEKGELESENCDEVKDGFKLPAGSRRAQLAMSPPRRLIAATDDQRPLYLNTPGLRVGRKEELLVVKEEDKVVQEIRIGDVSHVALFGNIQISTQAVQILCEKEVPISYFSMGGWFYGMTRGHELKNVFTRMEQFRLARDPLARLALAQKFVHGKIRNHRTMLMRSHLEPPAPIIAKLKALSESALKARSEPELLGTEGAAAQFYFSVFSGMLKAEDAYAECEDERQPALRFNFSGRNRRPPTDPVNAMLSLAYSLLAKDCTLAAMAVGFDPYIGFYHQPRFGRPSLALDVMEEFRPLIAESVVLTAINNRMLLPRHFVRAGDAVNLSTAGRKLFFQAYDQRMSTVINHPIFDYKASYRRIIELQFRILARFLTGEIAEYPPFVTR